jgi:hypothetical protein
MHAWRAAASPAACVCRRRELWVCFDYVLASGFMLARANLVSRPHHRARPLRTLPTRSSFGPMDLRVSTVSKQRGARRRSKGSEEARAGDVQIVIRSAIAPSARKRVCRAFHWPGSSRCDRGCPMAVPGARLLWARAVAVWTCSTANSHACFQNLTAPSFSSLSGNLHGILSKQ